jgi:hypothetical protein
VSHIFFFLIFRDQTSQMATTALVAGQAMDSAKSILPPILIGAVAAFAGWWFEGELRDFIGDYPWVLPIVLFFATAGGILFISR